MFDPDQGREAQAVATALLKRWPGVFEPEAKAFAAEVAQEAVRAALTVREEPQLAGGKDVAWWREQWIERNETVEHLRAALATREESRSTLRMLTDTTGKCPICGKGLRP